MKKIISLFLTLFVASSVWAVDFVSNGIYYNYVSKTEKTVAVTCFSSKLYSGNVSIPSSVTYNGNSYSVTSIGEKAFYNCSGLTSVTIPSSVTSIGEMAFYYCSGLTSVTIPNSVSSIGYYAFKGCESLTSVTIPNSVTKIGDSAFEGCSGLTSVTIPNSVTSIIGGTFSGCTGLTSVTIPNSVTSIGGHAFSGCTGLTSVTIPNSVTSIGWGAFSGCSGLTSVTIPNSVTSIGKDAFSGCTGLTSVTIPNSVTSIGGYAFSGCMSVTISGDISEIGSYAFNCKSVTLLEGVTKIGERAFMDCTGLTSVTIPNSVTSIGSFAFWGCTGLDSITIPSSVRFIASDAFRGTNFKLITNKSRQKMDFGFTKDGFRYNVDSDGDAEVASLLDGKYSGDVIIPNYVEFCGETYYVSSISYDAFTDCTELTSVTFPFSPWYPYSLFSGCTNLKKLTFLSRPFDYKVFEGVNTKDIYLYVPCEYYDEYTSSEYYFILDFEHIECIGSEKIEVQKDEVKVEPEKTEAVFSMPTNESANSYTLTISNNGVVFCTLTFNAQGQLSNIDFSTNKSYELKAGVSGYQFTVTGLSSATKYGYSFKALSSNKAVLKEYTGSFTTKNGDGTGGSSQGGEEVSGGSQGGEGGQGTETAIDGVSNTNAVTIVSNQIFVNGEAPAFVVTVSGQKIANTNLKAGVYFVNVEGETVGVSVR